MDKKKLLWGGLVCVLLSFSLTACGRTKFVNPSNERPTRQPAIITENMTYFSYSEDFSTFLNPERGWWKMVKTNEATESWFKNFRTKYNSSLLLLETNLGDFPNGQLSGAKLAEIRKGFDLARGANLSVIFRAAYDNYESIPTPDISSPEPENIDTIKDHIRQLADIFEENEDILYSVQAGLLGAYGEWHHTRFGNPIPINIQQAVVYELLNAVPESISVAVRRPSFVRGLNGGGTLSEDEAFGISPLARIAYHNDAVLSTPSDMGTFPENTRENELEWTNNHTRYTPFVGEANTLSAIYNYTDPAVADEILDRMNLQSMNGSYKEEVMALWKGKTYNGMNAYEYMQIMQGYRFVLQKAGFNTDIRRGGNLHLILEIENKGFGNLMKAKKLALVLKNGTDTRTFELDDDARFWDEDEPIVRDFNINIPSDIATGEWTAYLKLSSTFDTLKDNPAYSIRFANKDIWEKDTGLNKLGVITIN